MVLLIVPSWLYVYRRIEAQAEAHGVRTSMGKHTNLSPTFVKRADDGRYCDGNYLWLRVKNGSKSWIFRGPRINGKQIERGLGSATRISLSLARKKRDELLTELQDGREPATPRKIKVAKRNVLEDQIAAKADLFEKNEINPACFLYRLYDLSGDLIYVGFTLAPLRRTKEHRSGAAWRQMILQILIEPFATREEALEAETRAIREEFPRFNKTHNRRRHPVKELASAFYSAN